MNAPQPTKQTTPYQHRLLERAERGTQTQGEVIDNLLRAIEMKDEALALAKLECNKQDVGRTTGLLGKLNHALNEFP